jgi:phosphatidate cytidylyltransferase
MTGGASEPPSTSPAGGGDAPAKPKYSAKELAIRIATAAVLSTIVASITFADPTWWGVIVASALVSMRAQDEFLRMGLAAPDDAVGLGARLVAAGSAFAIVGGVGAFGPAVLPGVLMGAATLQALTLLLRGGDMDLAGRRLLICWAGLMYIPVFASTWPMLKLNLAPGWLGTALLTAFLSDAGAFFAGRSFGSAKLYPSISPSKTVAGSLGGLVGGLVASVGFGMLWWVPGLSLVHAIVLGLLGSVAGQLGDLLESLLKRTFHVKDAGTILPGHGGLLDRVDGLLLVGPFFYFYVTLLGLAR